MALLITAGDLKIVSYGVENRVAFALYFRAISDVILQDRLGSSCV